MIQGNASWPTETSKGKTQEGQEETSFPSSAKLVSNSTRVYGDEITWDILNITTGWCFETMEFYDFPETVGNVIIPTDFHSIIFQGARSTTNQTCYETDVQPVYVFHVCHEENGPLGFNRFNHGRYPYRSYQTSQRSHNRNLVGGLEHYFSYIGNNHPNWLFYISQRGWNLQPGLFVTLW